MNRSSRSEGSQKSHFEQKNKNSLKIDGKRTLAGVVALSAAATGAASAVENISPKSVDFGVLQHDINTLETVEVAGNPEVENMFLRSGTPTASELIGNNLFSVPIDIDPRRETDSLDEQRAIERLAGMTIYGLEYAGLTPQETRNALNAALESYNRLESDISVDTLIENANEIMIQETDRVRLEEISESLGYESIALLIGDYAAGAINTQTPGYDTLQQILSDNEHTTIDMTLTSELQGNLQATIYRTDEGYMIAVNQFNRHEEQGVAFSLVLIPVPFVWLRRRTNLEELDRFVKKRDKDLEKLSDEERYRQQLMTDISLLNFRFYGGRIGEEEYSRIVEAVQFLEERVSFEKEDLAAVYEKFGMHVAPVAINVAAKRYARSGSTFGLGSGRNANDETSSRTGQGEEQANVAEDTSDEHPSADEMTRSEDEGMSQEATPTDTETDNTRSTEEAYDTDESSEEEMKKRRRLKKIFIPIIIGSAALIPIAASSQDEPQSKERGFPTSVDFMKDSATAAKDLIEKGYERPTVGETAERYPGKPLPFDYLTSGSILVSYLDRKLVSYSTTGTDQQGLVTTRIDVPAVPIETSQSTPETDLRTIVKGYNWVIPSGGTGEGLMAQLGVDPSRWYEISPILAAEFGNELYGDPNAARFVSAGEVSEAFQLRVAELLDLQ